MATRRKRRWYRRYPIIPAILAITVLGERLAPNQYIGVLVLLAGLVGLGTAAA